MSIYFYFFGSEENVFLWKTRDLSEVYPRTAGRDSSSPQDPQMDEQKKKDFSKSSYYSKTIKIIQKL